jgi:hypothetical protein
MTVAAVTEIIHLVDTDDGFRERCFTDGESAIADFDLTDEERTALITGDRDRIAAMGVDIRESKMGPNF